MNTRSRQSIFSSRLTGAKIRAEGAREEARQAIRKADRAEAEAWSLRMEGYGGPPQPPPTHAPSLNGGGRGGPGGISPRRNKGHRSPPQIGAPGAAHPPQTERGLQRERSS